MPIPPYFHAARLSSRLHPLLTTSLRPSYISPKPIGVGPRQFITNPLNLLPEVQTLHAKLILPYAARDLYTLIADIAAYPTFLPYCTSSEITSWSAPHPEHGGKKYPRSATLKVGFKSYIEAFNSRVFCVPDRVVEAVCGNAKPTIPAEEIPHYDDSIVEKDNTENLGIGNEIFDSLKTRWTLRQFPYRHPSTRSRAISNVSDANSESGEIIEGAEPRTEVCLHIEVKFASPVYAALSQVAAPQVATMMVDAFEKRARDVLGPAKGAFYNGGADYVKEKQEETY
jgi:coenzyme Q-binding protein COQ10